MAWAAFPGLLTPGLAAGTFIQITRNTRNFSNKDDGLGNTFRMFRPGSSGTLTLLISASSFQHQALMTIANADALLKNVVAPMVITDNNTQEAALFTRASITTQPNVPKGTAPSIIPWVFDFEKMVQQPVGFATNIVGS